MIRGACAIVVGLTLYFVGVLSTSDYSFAAVTANLGCFLIGAGAAYYSLAKERTQRNHRERRT